MDLVWNMVYMYCDGSGLPSWTEIVFPLKMVTVRSLFTGFRGATREPVLSLGTNPAGVGSLVPLPRDSSGSWARLGGDPFWRSRLGLRWDLHLSGLWHARSSKGPVTGRRDQAVRFAWRRAPGRFRRQMWALGIGVGVS